MQLIFDLNHLAYRTLFACRNDIEQVGFKYHQHAMFNTILSMARKFTPDEVVLCVDDRKNWRKKIYSDYKAQRKDAREKSDVDWEKFYESFEEFVGFCRDHFPFYVLKLRYMEADDVAAVLARMNSDVKKVIITSDQDYIQLMRHKNVRIYDGMKSKFVKCDDPVRALKIKCLMGDKSDNIPAIKPRTGQKTAEKIADDPKLLKEILEHPDLGEEYKENYKRNIRLIDMNRIPDSLVSLAKESYENYEIPDGKSIFRFLTKHKFRDLLQRINDIEDLVKRLVSYNDMKL